MDSQHMRAVLAGVGSRGDYQPLLALGVALKARGHEVVMYGARNFADWTAREGLAFVGSDFDVDELLRANAQALSQPLQTFRKANQVMRDELACQFPALAQLAADSDVVLGMGFCMAGRSAAELAGIPFHMVLYCPQLLPSAQHPPFQIPFQNLPGWLNRWSHRAMAQVMQLAFGRQLNVLRRTHGLAARPDLHDAFIGPEVLLACDAQIASAPSDSPIASVELAAFCYDQPLELPADLRTFLNQGAPPLYLGFGSMVDPRPAETLHMLENVTQALGVRAVLHQSALAALPGVSSPRVHVVTAPLSHHALLPRCSLAIHHGGAGTTAAVARAAVPQVVVPHLFDQYFFAKRLQLCGVAPAPLPRRRLTTARLTKAIEQVLREPSYERAAEQLGRALAARNGITLAADWLESRYGGARSSSCESIRAS